MLFRLSLFWRYACVIALSCTILTVGSASHNGGHRDAIDELPIAFQGDKQHVIQPTPPPRKSFASIMDELSAGSYPKPTSHSRIHHHGARKYLRELRDALDTMQELYFSIWLGKWTTAIDWTAAVMSTHLSATLSSLSESVDYDMYESKERDNIMREKAKIENEINKFFSQSITSYFGEEAFSIRLQAYDDILWVVLEWLESIKFINRHATNHYASEDNKASPWYAQQLVPAFAHRARVFYELSEQGWDWHLCGGGMTWNPRLNPYKNAITNQLFISASASMYLHWPGDTNCSPFLSSTSSRTSAFFDDDDDEDGCTTRHPRDPIFLAAATNGFTWLSNSGMLNSAGLYTDGFHIKDYGTNASATECNDRNEMVYSYNQGVILSGLRALWIATANATYLELGHGLVNNVIAATGHDGKWAGLGRHGVLAEKCDEAGTCNQDGQTFKGIFFHHLTEFCSDLPRDGERGEREAHWLSCLMYTEWVEGNAEKALGTRDEMGRFGGWWGAPDAEGYERDDWSDGNENEGNKAVDYRNFPERVEELDLIPEEGENDGQELRKKGTMPRDRKSVEGGDLNDRGRGRTLETHGSGLAVVRAAYEFRKLAERFDSSL